MNTNEMPVYGIVKQLNILQSEDRKLIIFEPAIPQFVLITDLPLSWQKEDKIDVTDVDALTLLANTYVDKRYGEIRSRIKSLHIHCPSGAAIGQISLAVAMEYGLE